jgi:hypothetical protein
MCHRARLYSNRDGRLDLLIGDTPILDYYRANDPGCTLRTVDVIEEDNYAVGMTKGLHLQVSSSFFFFLSLFDTLRILYTMRLESRISQRTSSERTDR